MLNELQELMQCEEAPIFSNYYNYDRGIPQYDMNHQSLLNAINTFEKNNPDFHILGNYFNGISVSDSILKASNFVNSNY